MAFQSYKPTTQVGRINAGLTAGIENAAANRVAFQAALTAANTNGAEVFIAPGTFYVDRVAGAPYALLFQSLRNVRVTGVAGKSTIRCVDDISNGSGGEVKTIRISDCTNLTIEGLFIDGGWGNASTEISASGNLLTLPQATLPVLSTADFPSSGTLELITASGAQTIAYTGKTALTFTGCTGGTGAIRTGDTMVRFSRGQSSRTIALASNGADLPVSTLTVHGDLTAWPASARLGEVRVLTSAGWEYISYSSIATNGTTNAVLSGVSGGTGTVVGNNSGTGNSIQLVLGSGGQEATNATYAQIDPKNHAIFIYGSDGNASTPNRNIRIVNCEILNAYGDGIWIGQESYDVTIENVSIYLAARNGITLASFADGVVLDNVDIRYSGTTPFDSEPVEGSTRRVRGNAVQMTPWPNPGTANPNVVMSVWGGADLRPAEHNMASDWKFVNSTFNRGSVSLANAKDCTFVNCNFSNDDIASDLATSYAPVLLDRECTNIWFRDCNFSGRIGAVNSYNEGVVSIIPYRTGTNSANVPSDIHIHGGHIRARGGISGVFVEATGGYPGYSGTVESYTAPTSPNVAGSIVFTGTPFTGKLNWYLGRRVMIGGVVANITGNTADTLYVAPIAENYSAPSKAWSDRKGRAAANPTISAGVTVATIFPSGGWIDIQNVTIDCAQNDSATAGAYGVFLDPTSTFDEGYNQLRVTVRGCTIKGASDKAIYMPYEGLSNPNVYAELEIVDNKIRDDQPAKTTTVGIDVDPPLWHRIEFHGNTITPGIPLVQNLTDAPYWVSSSSFPPAYAGADSPEGLVYAPSQSTFVHLDADTTYQKQTSDTYATGWVAVKTAPRAAYRSRGALVAGVQNGSLTVPAAANNSGDIEFLQVISLESHGAVVLSTASGFASVATKTDGVLRMTVLARRSDGTTAAPIIDATSGGKFAVARIFAVKDVGTGVVADQIEDIETSTHTSSALDFTVAAATSVTSNALMVTFIGTHTGNSSSSSLASISSNDSDLIELQANSDEGQATLGDRYTMAVVTGRLVAAGSTGTLSGLIAATSGSAFVMAITLVLKQRTD